RRRHTRISRDWSSDVCSSDLMKRSAFHAITVDRVIDPRAQRALYSPNESGADQPTYRARAEAPRTASRRVDRGLREASRGECVEIGRASCREREKITEGT